MFGYTSGEMEDGMPLPLQAECVVAGDQGIIFGTRVMRPRSPDHLSPHTVASSIGEEVERRVQVW